MSEEVKPPLGLVSERTEHEIERDWALRSIHWPTREFVANLFRVIRGAGRPYALISQMFELTKVLAEAHEKASAWDVNQAFEEVLNDALPDWDWDDEDRGSLYTTMKGALQLIASNLLHQSTQQAAGRSEMYEGINRIINRREERRRQHEEEHREYMRSLRSTPKKRKAVKRTVAPKIPSPKPVAPPPKPEPVPDPQLLTTVEIMRINRQRLAEGKDPI